MILMIDNYDSFTYNLVQYLGQLGREVLVRRNDETSIEEIESLEPEAIFLSPGPRTPSEAGITVDVVRHFHRTVPILGVCLGHQAIGEAFGGRVIRAPRIVHGKTDLIDHDGTGVFAGLPSPLRATRYHSLCVDPDSLPDDLRVTATAADGTIMGLAHRSLPVEGVQFHPESIRSEHGHEMIASFLRRCSNSTEAA